MEEWIVATLIEQKKNQVGNNIFYMQSGDISKKSDSDHLYISESDFYYYSLVQIRVSDTAWCFTVVCLMKVFVVLIRHSNNKYIQSYRKNQ